MPSPEIADLHQKAVLWPAGGIDAYGEVLRSSPPVEIDVRWVLSREKYQDAQGNTVMLDGYVAVDRKIAIDSILWRGRLANWSGTSPLVNADELMQVRTYEEIPDVKGREVRRLVGVVRYRGELPAAV